MEKNLSDINPLLNQVGEDVMGFLNEIQLKYPKAISFASGRPDEEYFNLKDFSKYFDLYVKTISISEKKSKLKVLNSLGQYNRTKGIINTLVANYLYKDEKINVKPEDILITVGTQESFAMAILTLCNRDNDVIIVEDPAYVGITHFSIIAGYQIEPVQVNQDGISLRVLEEKINHFKTKGKKVKVVYVIPDYQNPTGNSMTLENRHGLLELAVKYDFLIIEDNAYSEFVYNGKKSLTLKALDVNERVIYLRSFSKTLYPSLRLGAMIANQKILNNGKWEALSDLMAKTKGYLTVNTSSINQAIFGGILIENNFSLKKMNKEKVLNMKRKRDQLLASLNKWMSIKKAPWAKEVSWNIPSGGFFITVYVPFNVTKADVVFCAENYQVIVTPMSFFYLGKGGTNEIRLAFSNIKDREIEPAIKNLATYFKSRITNH